MPILSKKHVPEELTDLQDTQMIGAILGGSMHILYVILFAICKINLLLWFNILISLPVFIIAFFFSYNGRLKASPIIGTIEVTIHQVGAVLLLGQSSNFHILLFCLIPIGMLFQKWKVFFTINSLMALILFLVISWFDSGQFIRYQLPQITLKLISSINSIGLFTIVGVIIFYYITLNKKLYSSQKATGEKLYQSNLELNETIEIVNEQKDEIESQRDKLIKTLQDLERTQNQLIESKKMSALGGLVAGVAHEINTPIGIGITAVSSLIEETTRMVDLYSKEEISRKDFKEFLNTTNGNAMLIQKNLERTANLIQSFKQVSIDQSTEQKREFFLKQYFEDIIHSLSPKFKGKKITVNLDCDENLKLNSYPGAFAQIYTNLLLNSLIHGFSKQEAGSIFIVVRKSDEELQIEYRDDGEGIDSEILPVIFEPFKTIDQSKGTGLGLHIVFNLVTQKLNGTISVDSEAKKGAKFILKLPITLE